MKDKRKMHTTWIRKRADFFFLCIKKTTAKVKINKAIIISTTNTKRETLELAHREDAMEINWGR